MAYMVKQKEVIYSFSDNPLTCLEMAKNEWLGNKAIITVYDDADESLFPCIVSITKNLYQLLLLTRKNEIDKIKFKKLKHNYFGTMDEYLE